MPAPTDTIVQTIIQTTGAHPAPVIATAVMAPILVALVIAAVSEARKARRIRNQQALDDAARRERRPAPWGAYR